MSLARVKKDDTVFVISGKDKGKRGKVESVLVDKQKVIVAGVNIVKRHTKPNPRVLQAGIVEKNAPLHWSKVMLVCTKCEKPTRVRTDWTPDGKKARFCKRCGDIIDKG
ncbi:MAG: 50S ribosomal protein L24 [Chloroflexota bacterium]|nr:50S ribosomal protein L24 [Chloroflexota bacterium]